MTAENVIVTVSQEIVMVAGRYRFRATEDRVPKGDPAYLPFNAWIDLPIPVPDTTRINEHLAIELVPELRLGQDTIKGRTGSQFTSLPSIEGVKFAAATFWLRPNTVEFEVTIRYHQPVINRDGRLWAYYIPLLPNFEANKRLYGLKKESYVVSFEAHLGTTLKLHTKHARVLQSSPKLVSLQVMHRELLEVEIIPTQP